MFEKFVTDWNTLNQEEEKQVEKLKAEKLEQQREDIKKEVLEELNKKEEKPHSEEVYYS